MVYEEEGDVGYLSFDFYNGAMSTVQCYRTTRRASFRAFAANESHRIADFWSNGIHLNVIEASNDPAKESWRNINAIDDLAADYIYSDSRVVLNPNYRAWASFMDRNTGHTCCQREWGKRGCWS